MSADGTALDFGSRSGDLGHTANMDAVVSYALWTLATVIAVGCGVAVLVW
jgi:uncharacterized membrane protein (Fun14 family)